MFDLTYLGSTFIPSFAPPKGMSSRAHFQVLMALSLDVVQTCISNMVTVFPHGLHLALHTCSLTTMYGQGRAVAMHFLTRELQPAQVTHVRSPSSVTSGWKMMPPLKGPLASAQQRGCARLQHGPV
jgi:hypothetical protein